MEYEVIKFEETRQAIEADLMDRAKDWKHDNWVEQYEGLISELHRTELQYQYYETIIRLFKDNPKRVNLNLEIENEQELLNISKELQLIAFEQERIKACGEMESTHYQVELCEAKIKELEE